LHFGVKNELNKPCAPFLRAKIGGEKKSNNMSSAAQVTPPSSPRSDPPPIRPPLPQRQARGGLLQLPDVYTEEFCSRYSVVPEKLDFHCRESDSSLVACVVAQTTTEERIFFWSSVHGESTLINDKFLPHASKKVLCVDRHIFRVRAAPSQFLDYVFQYDSGAFSELQQIDVGNSYEIVDISRISEISFFIVLKPPAPAIKYVAIHVKVFPVKSVSYTEAKNKTYFAGDKFELLAVIGSDFSMFGSFYKFEKRLYKLKLDMASVYQSTVKKYNHFSEIMVVKQFDEVLDTGGDYLLIKGYEPGTLFSKRASGLIQRDKLEKHFNAAKELKLNLVQVSVTESRVSSLFIDSSGRRTFLLTPDEAVTQYFTGFKIIAIHMVGSYLIAVVESAAGTRKLLLRPFGPNHLNRVDRFETIPAPLAMPIGGGNSKFEIANILMRMQHGLEFFSPIPTKAMFFANPAGDELGYETDNPFFLEEGKERILDVDMHYEPWVNAYRGIYGLYAMPLNMRTACAYNASYQDPADGSVHAPTGLNEPTWYPFVDENSVKLFNPVHGNMYQKIYMVCAKMFVYPDDTAKFRTASFEIPTTVAQLRRPDRQDMIKYGYDNLTRIFTFRGTSVTDGSVQFTEDIEVVNLANYQNETMDFDKTLRLFFRYFCFFVMNPFANRDYYLKSEEVYKTHVAELIALPYSQKMRIVQYFRMGRLINPADLTSVETAEIGDLCTFILTAGNGGNIRCFPVYSLLEKTTLNEINEEKALSQHAVIAAQSFQQFLMPLRFHGNSTKHSFRTFLADVKSRNTTWQSFVKFVLKWDKKVIAVFNPDKPPVGDVSFDFNGGQMLARERNVYEGDPLTAAQIFCEYFPTFASTMELFPDVAFYTYEIKTHGIYFYFEIRDKIAKALASKVPYFIGPDEVISSGGVIGSARMFEQGFEQHPAYYDIQSKKYFLTNHIAAGIAFDLLNTTLGGIRTNGPEISANRDNDIVKHVHDDATWRHYFWQEFRLGLVRVNGLRLPFGFMQDYKKPFKTPGWLDPAEDADVLRKYDIAVNSEKNVIMSDICYSEEEGGGDARILRMFAMYFGFLMFAYDPNFPNTNERDVSFDLFDVEHTNAGSQVEQKRKNANGSFSLLAQCYEEEMSLAAKLYVDSYVEEMLSTVEGRQEFVVKLLQRRVPVIKCEFTYDEPRFDDWLILRGKNYSRTYFLEQMRLKATLDPRTNSSTVFPKRDAELITAKTPSVFARLAPELILFEQNQQPVIQHIIDALREYLRDDSASLFRVSRPIRERICFEMMTFFTTRRARFTRQQYAVVADKALTVLNEILVGVVPFKGGNLSVLQGILTERRRDQTLKESAKKNIDYALEIVKLLTDLRCDLHNSVSEGFVYRYVPNKNRSRELLSDSAVSYADDLPPGFWDEKITLAGIAPKILEIQEDAQIFSSLYLSRLILLLKNRNRLLQ